MAKHPHGPWDEENALNEDGVSRTTSHIIGEKLSEGS